VEEVWCHTSVISPVVDAVVAGRGVYGYRAGADYILCVGPSER
jgi:3-dehydroquinate dehydratase